jgi:YD repeat-containing protein
VPAETQTTAAQLGYSHDCRNRLTAVNDASGNPLVTLEYDGTDALTQISTPDPSNMNSSVLRPLEQRTTDANGLTTSIVDARGSSVSVSYDGDNRVSQLTVDSGTTVGYEYDYAGRVNAITEGLTWTPSLKTAYQYGPAGMTGINHTNVTAAGVQTTQTYAIAYDPATGLISKKTDPLQRTASMTYDAAGNLTQVSLAGSSITYAYDALRRLSSKSFAPSGASARYAYDAAGNLTFAQNAVATMTWTYDLAGRLTDRTVAFTGTAISLALHYRYDKFGNLARRFDETGFTIRYGYDNANHLTGVFLGSDTQPAVQFAYGPAAVIATMTLARPNVTTGYTYDTSGAVLSIASARAGMAVSGHSYTRESKGRILTATRTGQVQTLALGYDEAGRLNNSSVSDAPAATARTRYGYDAIGNRTSQRDSTRLRLGAFDDKALKISYEICLDRYFLEL